MEPSPPGGLVGVARAPDSAGGGGGVGGVRPSAVGGLALPEPPEIDGAFGTLPGGRGPAGLLITGGRIGDGPAPGTKPDAEDEPAAPEPVPCGVAGVATASATSVLAGASTVPDSTL
eukprot:4409797-Alexandrium_andersonii.AAC.1